MEKVDECEAGWGGLRVDAVAVLCPSSPVIESAATGRSARRGGEEELSCMFPSWTGVVSEEEDRLVPAPVVSDADMLQS
jgi:hypothetical protein